MQKNQVGSRPELLRCMHARRAESCCICKNDCTSGSAWDTPAQRNLFSMQGSMFSGMPKGGRCPLLGQEVEGAWDGCGSHTDHRIEARNFVGGMIRHGAGHPQDHQISPTQASHTGKLGKTLSALGTGRGGLIQHQDKLWQRRTWGLTVTKEQFWTGSEEHRIQMKLQEAIRERACQRAGNSFLLRQKPWDLIRLPRLRTVAVRLN